MPRTRTDKIAEVKLRLIARARAGRERADSRFPSARAVARRHHIAYQTAHRLLAELAEEGWLERHATSGTIVALGARSRYRCCRLVFHARAARPQSFGAYLLELLSHELDERGVAYAVSVGTPPRALSKDEYPAVWEQDGFVRRLARNERAALVLNEHPSVGLAATKIDSIAADDFSGGVCAAELFRQRGVRRAPLILAGAPGDPRNLQRVAGFRSLFPKAPIVESGSWYYEDARAVAGKVLRQARHGVFCCNDRLACAVLDLARETGAVAPPMVGFDDAPVAQAVGLTTIALPWHEMVRSAATIIQRRLEGATGPACRQIFAPHPVLRDTL